MPDGNNGPKTGRALNGRFARGNAGRPRGARHKTTLVVEALLDGEAKGLTRKAVEMAMAGDTTALRLCLERICPPRKDAPVQFDVPEMRSAADATKALGAILDAVAAGEITPSQAGSLAGLVEGFRKTLETEDQERRVVALEHTR